MACVRSRNASMRAQDTVIINDSPSPYNPNYGPDNNYNNGYNNNGYNNNGYNNNGYNNNPQQQQMAYMGQPVYTNQEQAQVLSWSSQ